MPIRLIPIPSALRTAAVLMLVIPWMVSCAGPNRNPDESLSTQSGIRPQIIALINGSPITQDQILDDLSERAGKQALIDLIIDHQLSIEINDHQITITPADLDREEHLFLDTIAELDPKAPMYDLLDALKSSKGLGEDRYPRFLRRNAALRKLVSQSALPSEQEFLLAERIAFGPRYALRLFVSTNAQRATQLRQQVLGAPRESQKWIFADACAADSIHPSAPRGGLITNFSIDDPGFPAAITDGVRDIQPGQLSAVLATDAGFALVLVESRLPAIDPTDGQIQSLRAQLTHRKELLAMQRLADELLADAQVSVLDRTLNWAWTHAK